jgi:glucosamine--fructose-6-phosphate aminotransferase (isomerizing)
MCGICAYIGSKEACKVMYEGLTILQNRGYDSAGMATINHSNDNNIIVTKNISKNTTSDSILYLGEKLHLHKNNTIGISHTRWASNGSITVENSHPHGDIGGRFSIVHNGIIENHNEIRNFLSKNGIECVSETDTEVIVQLIYFYSLDGYGFRESVEKALARLEGTWGLVILDRENPNTMIAARHGSPILVGLGQDEVYVGSEIAAFQKYTTQYISLNNDEMAIITHNNNNSRGNKINLSLSGPDYKERIKIAEKEEILLSPDPYPHWTIREINEQPQSIRSAINNGGRILNDHEVILGGLNRNKERLLSIENLIIVGCGTSKHAGMYISDIMRKIAGFNTVQVVDGSEFDQSYMGNGGKGFGILALSQSGETKDVMRCLEMINDDVVSFSVVNRVGSQIARTTNCGVYLNAGREMAVASTKAFTSQITVLSLIAIWYGQYRNIHKKSRTDLIENIMRLSSCYQSILSNETINTTCEKISCYLKDQHSCFVLGKGLSSYIAYEGALKIKEIGYIHAEGYQGGALKHGPFALIEKGTPIIIILLNDKDRSYMESTVNEVKARGAHTIVITNIKSYDYGDININIPDNGILSSFLATVPLQLIAYKLSIAKGIDPDKPRHLCKTVTIV